MSKQYLELFKGAKQTNVSKTGETWGRVGKGSVMEGLISLSSVEDRSSMVGREKHSEPLSADHHTVLRPSWSSTGLPEEAE